MVQCVLEHRPSCISKFYVNFLSCESRSSVLTMCGALVGGEEVGARVVLLRVGLATLRILLYSEVCTVSGQERVALLDRG